MSAAGQLFRELDENERREVAEMLRPYLDQTADDRLLTPSEAAARLSVHRKTLVRAAAAGRVPGAQRVGKGWRFDPRVLALEPPAGIRPAPATSRRRPSSNGSGGVAAAIKTGGTRAERST
ncbi:MAG: helix-turn-helix domain-containing protein [Solirubrobacteraceae bacterium]